MSEETRPEGLSSPPGERQMDYPEYVAMLEKRIEQLEQRTEWLKAVVFKLPQNMSVSWPNETPSLASSQRCATPAE